MTNPVKMLLICVDETDLWETGTLYEAIVRRLRQLGVAGATVQTGIMGFGSHGKVHHKRLFGISDDKPVIWVSFCPDLGIYHLHREVDNEDPSDEKLTRDELEIMVDGMVKAGQVQILVCQVDEKGLAIVYHFLGEQYALRGAARRLPRNHNLYPFPEEFLQLFCNFLFVAWHLMTPFVILYCWQRLSTIKKYLSI